MALLNTEPTGASFSERRRGARFEVCVEVVVSTLDGVIFASEMINVSNSGFRMRSPMVLAPGCRLVARFRHTARRRATVAWQKGEEIGCHFDRPLGQKQLDSLAAGG